MIILENVALANLDSGDLMPGYHVAIEGEQIVEVADRPISASTAERINIDGRCLLPGLIDAHFHAALTETSPAAWRDVPPTLMTARAGVLLKGALMRGFTTVRDMAGADWGMRAATAEGTLIGPRMMIAGRALSQTGGHGDLRNRNDTQPICSCSSALSFMSVVADGVPAVQAAVREQLRQGVDHVKVFVSGGVASPNDPLMSVQYSDQELMAIVAEARSWGTYVAAHAYTPASILRAVGAGIRTIEHGNLLDEPSAKAMAAAGAFLVPTLVIYDTVLGRAEAAGFSRASRDKLAEVSSAGLHSIEVALAAGVRLGFGTDLLGDLHQHQCKEFLLRARVQAPREVLRSATQVNAEIVGLAGKLGTISPGATADLIAMRGDPMRDLGLLQDQGAHLDLIMKAGVAVKRNV